MRVTATLCLFVTLLMAATTGCGSAHQSRLDRAAVTPNRLYSDLSSCLRSVGRVRDEPGAWPRSLLMLTHGGGLLRALVFRTTMSAGIYAASYGKEDAAYRRRARKAGISAPDGTYAKHGRIFVHYAGLDRTESTQVDRCLTRLG